MTYVQIIDRYFSTKIENEKLEIMLKALIEGDIKLFEKMLRKVVLAVFSYHDFGGEPEKVYHALDAALEQIEEKKYQAELIERGIKKIKKMAIAFSGKKVYVKC